MICAALAAAAVAYGQGSGAPPTETVTVYSSLPLRGVNSRQASAVERGIRLALEEAEGQAGLFHVRYRSLDDSTRRARAWDPGRESRNARWTYYDENAVAYIGAFNSAATAISLPILNEGRVFQVSPTNTMSGLTRDDPGTGPGEPERYYPRIKRNYARVIPRNTIQGAALGLMFQDSGCKRAYLLRDGTWQGREVVQSARRFSRRHDIAVVGLGPIHRKAPNYRGLAAAIRDRRADCVLFAGLATNNAVQLFRDVSRVVPGAQLFGSDELAAAPWFTDPRRGGIPRRVARKTLLTHPALAHSAYPPAGQDFFTRYRARYGTSARLYGIYGYEAMSLVLDAIARAGAEGDERAAVIAAGLATRDRESVLGTYSIDPFGDTTLTDFGVYRIKHGRPSWDRVVRP